MPARAEPRIAQESPVRIFGMNASGAAINVSAWTVDVSHHGARVRGVKQAWAPGETVGLRHGTEKARYQIVWVGANGTPQQGQAGLQSMESGKYIWGTAGAPAAQAGMQTGSFPSPEPLGRLPIALAPQRPAGNRRQFPRYHADGTAKVQEVGAPAPQWTTVHDLSMGGCYVETAQPLPDLTPVELTINVGDVQFTALGAVTVRHHQVGMGIKFTKLSPLNRERLETVMRHLKQTSTET